MILTGYSNILFDLDGTLVDSSECIVRSTRETFAAYDLPVPMRETILHMMGIPIEKSFIEFAGGSIDGKSLELLMQDFRTRYNRYSGALVRPFEGMPELIRKLRTTGKKVAIVTSKRNDSARRNLVSAGIDVDALIGSDSVSNFKPHPETVEKAIQALGKPNNSSVVVVGDSIHDIEMGKRAGVATVGVAWGAHDEAALRRAGAAEVYQAVAALRGALLG